MRKSIFTLKIILLSILPVLIFSLFTISIITIKIGKLSDNVSEVAERALNNIYSQIISDKSRDIAKRISLKLNIVFDELDLLRASAQQIVDNEELHSIGVELQSNTWFKNDFVYNSAKNWSNISKTNSNVSMSVWGYLHNKDGSINRNAEYYTTLMSPLKMLMQVMGEHGVDKGWCYIVGPKATPVMIMTPWAQMPEIFDEKYPEHNTRNWWDFFFPGIVEAWNQWTVAPDFKSDRYRDQVTLTPIYEDAGGTGLMVTFFAPLWNKDRTENFGSAAIDYNINRIVDIGSKEKIGETGCTFLMQSDGNVLGITNAIADILGLSQRISAKPGVAVSFYNLKESKINELADIANKFTKVEQSPIYEFSDNKGEEYLITFQKTIDYNLWPGEGANILRESLYIVGIVPKKEVFQIKDSIQIHIHNLSRKTLFFVIAISAFITIMAIFLASWYALQNTRQIRKMGHGIKAVGNNRYDIAIDVIAKDDLGDLARSFNYMISEIHNAYSRLEKHALDLENKVKERTVHLEEANHKLLELSMNDGLTGISNRRYFDMRFVEIWREYSRLKHSISLILIDIDHFKRYNDSYGHQEGDNCLRAIAGALKSQAKRSSDVVARYGGEEFAVITCTPLKQAFEFAEILRSAVRSLSIEHKSSDKGIVSISLGVASVTPSRQEDMSALVKRADQALYLSKEKGRDTVVISQTKDDFSE